MKKGITWIGILFIGFVAAFFCGRGVSGRDGSAERLQQYGNSFLDQMLTMDGDMSGFVAEEWQHLLVGMDLTGYQPDDLAAAYVLFRQLWEMAGYEVLSGEFTEAGYVLSVRLYPVDGLIRFAALYDDYTEDFRVRNRMEEFGHFTDGEYQQAYQEGLINLMKEAFGSATALPAVEKGLLLFCNDNGEYEVSEADFTAVRDDLVPLQ